MQPASPATYMRRLGMAPFWLEWKVARTPLSYSMMATWWSTISLSELKQHKSSRRP